MSTTLAAAEPRPIREFTTEKFARDVASWIFWETTATARFTNVPPDGMRR